MGPNDTPNNKDKKNPWGKAPIRPTNNRPGDRGPWGGGNEPPPELDDMIRRAQENLRQVMPGGAGGGALLSLLAVAAIILWLASGLFIITPGEHGVIQKFGAHTRTQITEGLGYHLPWPVETVTKVNVSQSRRIDIGFNERGSARNTSGTKTDIPEESLMLTSDANIVNLDMIVLWNIKSAEDYLFNIYDPESTIKRVAESAIREVVGQTKMFSIITQSRDDVARRAQEIMIANLDKYKSGVSISQVAILEAEVHPDVQEAFQDVQSAKQDAFEVQNRAQAYREDILPKARGLAIQMRQEAQGYQQSVVAKATGNAERFNATLSAYRNNEDVTKKRLYIETMEDLLSTAQTIILDEKGGNGAVPYLTLNDLRAATPKSTQ